MNAVDKILKGAKWSLSIEDAIALEDAIAAERKRIAREYRMGSACRYAHTRLRYLDSISDEIEQRFGGTGL